MGSTRKSAAETRSLIVDAVGTLMVEHDPEYVSVVSVMREANVSRTAFYRQFDTVYDVYAEILMTIRDELLRETGDWVTDPAAVGTPGDAHPTIERYATSLTKHIGLLTALHDACGCDSRLRELWKENFVKPFADATEASIVRDQAAGAVSLDVDPVTTAMMLTFLGEITSIELMGRQHVTPQRYADIVAPLWRSVLFGVVPDTDRSIQTQDDAG
jgi:AcrR family transcriptional regulator